MSDIGILLKFCHNFSQDIFQRAEQENETRENAFTGIIVDAFNESDITENGFVCSHRQKTSGIAVNGYAISDDEDTLDLFISVYTGKIPPESISKTEIDSAFNKVDTFFKRCCSGYHRALEESQPIFDLAIRIFEIQDNIRKIRYFLLTDRISKKIETISDKTELNKRYSYNIWDINRILGLINSDGENEPIQIDISGENGDLIPCVTADDGNPVYTSYLAIIPGKTLIDIYEKFGTRIFERNVRSFLQVRGSVNKGIRDTVLNEPEMFLAYNNGISATAENILITKSEGGQFISRIKNFQIVNGAQTTATLHYTYFKYPDEVDPSFLQIPLKLTVLHDLTQLDDLIPKISEYANTQNKIDAADFSSNHPFHAETESLSRRIRAPATGGSQIETYWYYERVRGQYANDRNKEKTTSLKKGFDKRYPKDQKFDKTELAVFDHIYECRPFEVSLGKQKNYKIFMADLNDREDEFVPDEQYFRDLISKAILFKKTHEIVRKEISGGYRANIVAYSLSLLHYRTNHTIDLNKIWKEQDLYPDLKSAITELVQQIQEFILHPPDGKNITEWCKKKDCWIALLKADIKIPEKILKGADPEVTECENETKSDAGRWEITTIPSMTWSDMIAWSRETHSLSVSDMGNITRHISQMKQNKPLLKYSSEIMRKILDKALNNGFDLQKSIEMTNSQIMIVPADKAAARMVEEPLKETELNEMQKSILHLLHKNRGKISQKNIFYELVKIFQKDPLKIRSEYLKEKKNLVKLKYINHQVVMGNLRLSESGVEYCLNLWGQQDKTEAAVE